MLNSEFVKIRYIFNLLLGLLIILACDPNNGPSLSVIIQYSLLKKIKTKEEVQNTWN